MAGLGSPGTEPSHPTPHKVCKKAVGGGGDSDKWQVGESLL